MPTYNKAYFLKTLGAIPASKWCAGELSDDRGRKCALGHVSNAALSPFVKLFLEPPIYVINNGHDPRYQQKTPKARVMAALRDLP